MPGLIGYMLAIVVTLSGYFAGLQWLLNPPDPWQPNPKIARSDAQQVGAKKRLPPVIKRAEASAASELTASTEAAAKLARVETSVPVQTSENATIRPAELNIVEATQPIVEPARIVRREVPPTKTKSSNRKRIERNPAASWN